MFLAVCKITSSDPLEIPLMWNHAVKITDNKQSHFGKDISIFSKRLNLHDFAMANDSNKIEMLLSHLEEAKKSFPNHDAFYFEKLEIDKVVNILTEVKVQYFPNGEMSVDYLYINYEKCKAYKTYFKYVTDDHSNDLKLLVELKILGCVNPQSLSYSTCYSTNDEFTQLIKTYSKYSLKKLRKVIDHLEKEKTDDQQTRCT